MIVLAVVLLIFGPRNLPKLGAMIGKTIGSFRDAATKGVDEDEETPKAPASIDSRKEPR